MHKVLIGVALLAVAVAVGVVVAVMMMSPQKEGNDSRTAGVPGGAPGIAGGEAGGAGERSPGSRSTGLSGPSGSSIRGTRRVGDARSPGGMLPGGARVSQGQPGTGGGEAGSRGTDGESSEATVGSESRPGTREEALKVAASDLEGLVGALTLEEEQKLFQILSQRQSERARKQARYTMPSEWKVQMLNFRNQPELKVTESQQQGINALRDGMKPRMDEVLSDVWTRTDEIYGDLQRINTAQREASAEERAAYKEQLNELYRELSDLNLRTSELKRQFDEEFMRSVLGLLTPEQVKAIETWTAGYGQARPWSAPGGGGEWKD